MGQGADVEGNAPDRLAVRQFADFGRYSFVVQVLHEGLDARDLQIASEDCSDLFGLVLLNHELLVPGDVSERHIASHPEAFSFGGSDFVADALGRDLALELGKGQQDIEREAPHGRRGIELLGYGNERHALGVEQFDQFGEVSQRAGQTIDFVNDNDVDFPGFHVR